MEIKKLTEELRSLLKEELSLKTRWEQEMLNYPIIETASGEIYLQPSDDDKFIQYGTMTNGGMIVEGQIEYEPDKSLDYHIQALADEIFDKYGYPEINEAIGDITREGKTLNHNNITEYDEGKFVYEIMGIPISYQMKKTDITDSGDGEELEKDQKFLNGYSFELENSTEVCKFLENKIKENFIKQIKDRYNLNINNITGNILVGVPTSGSYKR